MLLRPMSEFDPAEPAFVHDAVSNRAIPWSPDFQSNYEQTAHQLSPGLVAFEGLLLDGWTEGADAGTLN